VYVTSPVPGSISISPLSGSSVISTVEGSIEPSGSMSFDRILKVTG